MSFNKFGLTEKQKNNGLLYVANTHRFVVLIQDQDLAVQPTMNAF